MPQISHPARVVTTILANLLTAGTIATVATAPHAAAAASHVIRHATRPVRVKPSRRPRLDFSGRNHTGIASFYADWFAGKKMADGVRMNPRSNNAASRTLPLGTIARVTNLRTHKSAVVTIQDRGPYVQGRIVDLSPSTARKIGITRQIGIAEVRVTPVVLPRLEERHQQYDCQAKQRNTKHRAEDALSENVPGHGYAPSDQRGHRSISKRYATRTMMQASTTDL